MPRAADPIVLDTHVWVWWACKAPIAEAAKGAIERAAEAGQVLVPAIGVWEVAMLVSKNRLQLSLSVHEWCARALSLPGFSLAPLLPEVSIDACTLPGTLHQDPADRLIIATARQAGGTLVTRDEKLLAYGAAGHLAVLAA